MAVLCKPVMAQYKTSLSKTMECSPPNDFIKLHSETYRVEIEILFQERKCIINSLKWSFNFARTLARIFINLTLFVQLKNAQDETVLSPTAEMRAKG